MPVFSRVFAAALITLTVGTSVHAGESPKDASEGWNWLASTNEIQTEGVFWNDAFGDGKDRWKSGGVTQSYVFPEHIFSDENWFTGRASALEFSIRGLVMTPDNTAFSGIDSSDRPYAQYAAVGVYLRSIARPEALTSTLALLTEDRIGLEAGWQGDPLPFFDVQNAVHGITGTEGNAGNLSNSIDSEMLANIEARRTWRLHIDGYERDIEFAPFVQTSLGMRENSARVGGDVFFGSALEGRTWGSDLATGAVMAGASMPRRGFNWAVFAGGDLGYIASDAFLDGGFAADGPRVERRDMVGRARAGVLLDYGKYAIGFSMNWLGKEFRGQSEGQMIGAIQLKYRF
jgi:hypothetical protein